MPSAIISFSDNRADVDRLLEIHQSIGGSAPGRRWGLEVLHKAAVVLTCSIWEAFVEDLIQEAVAHLAQHLNAPDRLPNHLKQQISKQIKADPHDLSPWRLAGSGWQQVIRANAVAVVSAATGRLNTPKSPQLKELFERSLGITDITSTWKRRKLSVAQATAKLDGFITLRGAIAHRGQAASSVTKVQAEEFISLVTELVRFTDDAVRAHVKALTGIEMPLQV